MSDDGFITLVHKPTEVKVKIITEPLERPAPPANHLRLEPGDGIVFYDDGSFAFQKRAKLRRWYQAREGDKEAEDFLADS